MPRRPDVSRLGSIRQPWLFALLALGFGVVAYFASGESVVRTVIGGVLFAVLISAWLRIRRRWRH
jgi:hypothetical protein